MKLSVFVAGLITIFTAVNLHAATQFSGEAEAGAVLVSGNNDSESYAAKGKAVYTQDQNIYTASGRYLKTESNGLESARNWEAGVRYDRALTEYLGVFVGHKAESDVFNGYIQRDSSDVGLKQFLTKTDTLNWSVEAGYRYTTTHTTLGDYSYDNFARLYTEYNQALDKTLSFKYWAEYLPNFTESDAWLGNTEISLNVMLNSVFSLKLGYLLQYQNVPADNGKHTTTTTTMNLVAKF